MNKRETISGDSSKKFNLFFNLPSSSNLKSQLKKLRIYFILVCITNLFLGGYIIYFSLTDDGSYEYLPISENTTVVYLKKDNSTQVILTKELKERLNELYFVADREFQVCLNGTKLIKNNQTIYNLNSYYLPSNQKRWRNAISSECEDLVLAEVHSHPENTCLTNTDDLEVFTDYNKEELMGTICGKNKFFFIFDKENPKLARVI